MARSILIVDDDPAFRELARRLVTAAGLTVVGEAATATEALAVARELRPDAALVDIDLPDRSGVALAHELTALPFRPRAVLTSDDAEAAPQQAVERSGASAFVYKGDLADGTLRQLLGSD